MAHKPVRSTAHPPHRGILLLRWVARGWSLASIGMLLLFFLGMVSEPPALTLAEFIGVLLFPVGVVAGMVVAWWREVIGGAITAGSLALFYVLDLLVTGTFPGGPFFILFAAPGLLFLLVWWLARPSASRPAMD